MERFFLVGSLVVMAALPLACGSDSDDSSGTGGTSSGGSSSGGSAGSSSGGSAGSSSGGSAGGAPTGVTCEELCAQVVPLGCTKGPPSEALCVAFCNGTKNGTGDAADCATAMNGVLTCETLDSDMSCAADGYVTSTACATRWTAVNPCLPAL